MSAPDGGPAFPFKCPGSTTAPEVYYGMTLRDYFAAQALNGYLAGRNCDRDAASRFCVEPVAAACYAYADAVLAAGYKDAALPPQPAAPAVTTTSQRMNTTPITESATRS